VDRACGDALSLAVAGAGSAFGTWRLPSLHAAVLAAPPLSLPVALPSASALSTFAELFHRSYPSACTQRDFVRKLRTDVASAALPTLRVVVAVGMLGAHASCTVRANFRLRVGVHRDLAFGALAADDELFREWCVQNALLVRAIVQELLFELVEDMPWVRAFLEQRGNWAQLRALAGAGMDDARRRLNAGVHLTDVLFRDWHRAMLDANPPRLMSSQIARFLVDSLRRARGKTPARRKRKPPPLDECFKDVVHARKLRRFEHVVAPLMWKRAPRRTASLLAVFQRLAGPERRPLVMPAEFAPEPRFPVYLCMYTGRFVEREGKKHRMTLFFDADARAARCGSMHSHPDIMAPVLTRDVHRLLNFEATRTTFCCPRCNEPRVANRHKLITQLEEACPHCAQFTVASLEPGSIGGGLKCWRCKHPALFPRLLVDDEHDLRLVGLCRDHAITFEQYKIRNFALARAWT